MNANERELIYKDEVYRIVGAAMNVSNELGRGFLEAVYQEALEMEFKECDIPFEPQKRINISYKRCNRQKSEKRRKNNGNAPKLRGQRTFDAGVIKTKC